MFLQVSAAALLLLLTLPLAGGVVEGNSPVKGDSVADQIVAGDTAGDTVRDTAGDTKGDTAGDTKDDTKGDTKGNTKGDTPDSYTDNYPSTLMEMLYEYVWSVEPTKWILRGMALADLCALELNQMSIHEMLVCGVWSNTHYLFFFTFVLPMVTMGILISFQVRCWYTDIFTGLWEHRFQLEMENMEHLRRQSRSPERTPREQPDLRPSFPSPPRPERKVPLLESMLRDDPPMPGAAEFIPRRHSPQKTE